ncbi:hypothetical protein UR09_04800 [Candidatus Nitromaritima sp. SCGC AAA799-A02]|nr:hypothetical protein UR09_04800 [Candidatus Nitromaritima sp. SCGC AAA799-A02]
MTEHSILIVDDDENILNSVKRSLKKENFNVLTATDARQGLKYLTEKSIDVVVSDQNMPGMTGIEFLKQVKIKYPKTTRMLFTGFADKDVSVRAIQETNVFKILKKPCNADELLRAVQIALQLQEFRSKSRDQRNPDFESNTFRLIEKYKQKLVEGRFIEESQLREAVQIQKTTGENLGAVLLKCDFLTEEILLSFLGDQLSFEVIKLEDIDIDPETLRCVPKKVAINYKTIPLFQRSGIITVALSDPYNYSALQNIWALLGSKIEIKVCPEAEILAAINKFHTDESPAQTQESMDSLEKSFSIHKMSTHVERRQSDRRQNKSLKLTNVDQPNYEINLDAEVESPPIVKAFNRIIMGGIQKESSDIHISAEKGRTVVRYRIDGVMVDGEHLPKEFFLPVVSRIKVLASLDISKRYSPQDGRLKLKLGKKKIDARISTYPAKYGESVVLRLLESDSSLIRIEGLGFSESDRIKVEKLLFKNQGLILSTGPTGSGKTTTLYSIIKALNTEGKKIITIDDPIEYQVDGIVQGEVNALQGMTFPRALRSVLRQDPDIILVGEIRDTETAEIAFQAAMTGHLVLSTLHTGSAASTLTRLLDLGIPRFVISASLIGVIAQRLVRKICLKCKNEHKVDPALFKIIDLKKTDEPKEVYKGKGCIKCNNTGYKGRLGLFEVLEYNEEMKNQILTKSLESDLEVAAIRNGMTLLKQDGINKATLGLTTFEEVARVC